MSSTYDLSRTRAASAERRRLALEHLEKVGEATSLEMASVLKMTSSQAGATLQSLVSRGLVKWRKERQKRVRFDRMCSQKIKIWSLVAPTTDKEQDDG